MVVAAIDKKVIMLLQADSHHWVSSIVMIWGLHFSLDHRVEGWMREQIMEPKAAPIRAFLNTTKMNSLEISRTLVSFIQFVISRSLLKCGLGETDDEDVVLYHSRHKRLKIETRHPTSICSSVDAAPKVEAQNFPAPTIQSSFDGLQPHNDEDLACNVPCSVRNERSSMARGVSSEGNVSRVDLSIITSPQNESYDDYPLDSSQRFTPAARSASSPGRNTKELSSDAHPLKLKCRTTVTPEVELHHSVNAVVGPCLHASPTDRQPRCMRSPQSKSEATDPRSRKQGKGSWTRHFPKASTKSEEICYARYPAPSSAENPSPTQISLNQQHSRRLGFLGPRKVKSKFKATNNLCFSDNYSSSPGASPATLTKIHPRNISIYTIRNCMQNPAHKRSSSLPEPRTEYHFLNIRLPPDGNLLIPTTTSAKPQTLEPSYWPMKHPPKPAVATFARPETSNYAADGISAGSTASPDGWIPLHQNMDTLGDHRVIQQTTPSSTQKMAQYRVNIWSSPVANGSVFPQYGNVNGSIESSNGMIPSAQQPPNDQQAYYSNKVSLLGTPIFQPTIGGHDNSFTRNHQHSPGQSGSRLSYYNNIGENASISQNMQQFHKQRDKDAAGAQRSHFDYHMNILEDRLARSLKEIQDLQKILNDSTREMDEMARRLRYHESQGPFLRQQWLEHQHLKACREIMDLKAMNHKLHTQLVHLLDNPRRDGSIANGILRKNTNFQQTLIINGDVSSNALPAKEQLCSMPSTPTGNAQLTSRTEPIPASVQPGIKATADNSTISTAPLSSSPATFLDFNQHLHSNHHLELQDSTPDANIRQSSYTAVEKLTIDLTDEESPATVANALNPRPQSPPHLEQDLLAQETVDIRPYENCTVDLAKKDLAWYDGIHPARLGPGSGVNFGLPSGKREPTVKPHKVREISPRAPAAVVEAIGTEMVPQKRSASKQHTKYDTTKAKSYRKKYRDKKKLEKLERRDEAATGLGEMSLGTSAHDTSQPTSQFTLDGSPHEEFATKVTATSQLGQLTNAADLDSLFEDDGEVYQDSGMPDLDAERIPEFEDEPLTAKALEDFLLAQGEEEAASMVRVAERNDDALDFPGASSINASATGAECEALEESEESEESEEE